MWSRCCFHLPFFSPLCLLPTALLFSSLLFSCFASPVLPSPANSLCSACLHRAPCRGRVHVFPLLSMYVHVCPKSQAIRDEYMRERAHPWTCAGSCTHLHHREACCDVIEHYSHYHSESVASVGTPPPSALRQHQSKAAAFSERRGCWPYYEERVWMWRQKCKEISGEGCLLLAARINSTIDRLLLFEYMLNKKRHFCCTHLIRFSGVCVSQIFSLRLFTL